MMITTDDPKVSDLTVPLLLARNAREHGSLPALTSLAEPSTSLTWAQLRERVAELAAGLAQLGLQSGDRMLISSNNRPEHWLIDYAAVHVGAVPCTAYATLSTPQLAYLGRHSAAVVLVIEGQQQWERWRPVLDQLPALRHVILLDETLAVPEDPRFRSFAELRTLGAKALAADPEAFEKGWRAVRPEQPVTLLYTSGTTGDPKGVLLSHRNVIFQAATGEVTVPLPEHTRTVAYLPLAHIAERVLAVYAPLFRVGHVHIAPDAAAVGAGLRTVRPGSFFGVPRVWEKLAAAVLAILAGADEKVRAASEVALRAYQLRARSQPVPAELAAQLEAVDDAALRPIRALLGLDQVQWAGSGAAPIPVDVLLVLAGIGVDVMEVWGMTETTGGLTHNTPEAFRTGSVGRPTAGSEIKLGDDGELLVRSPLVALGYLRADGGVDPITDAEGWLATGDVATLDAEGFLAITDRKKELLITASGKNVSPAQIENLLRAHPLIGYAAAIGDGRPYITALISLDEEVLPGWAQARGLPGNDFQALTEHEAVVAEIRRAVDAANVQLSRPEQVKRFRILPRPWTPESGELTPTLKLRRRIIAERHAAAIEELYL
jgi:long-chain acyl-CoA synthetase